MASIGDLVHQSSASTGSGNLTLASINGKRTFASVFGTGAPTDVFYYYVSNRNAAEWEWGTGHMSDSTTLVRDTIITSSNSNSAVSFSAGTLDVVNDLPASIQALIHYLSSNGIIARTAADTIAARTITAPAAGISVSNGDGASGNPTLALANDLSALEGLGSTGIAVRTTTDTWAQRTITGTANDITVTNGDGVSGNPTIDLTSAVLKALAVLSNSAGTLVNDGAGSLSWAARTDIIEFIIDGGGSTITTGLKGYIQVPFACTITQATLLADQTGSIVVNVWKTTYSSFAPGTHPVSGDKITASAPPTISSAAKAQDATLTGWTTSISAGDIIAFNVDSVTTIQRVTIALQVTKT
jgi:hypothetical protein